MATYYVNPTTGDNANSGTSPDFPWLIPPKFAGVTGNADITLNGGDTLYLMDGTFRPGTGGGFTWDHTINGDPVTIAAYPGTVPIIDCLYYGSQLTWEHTGGGIWRAPVSNANTPSPSLFWIDDEMFFRNKDANANPAFHEWDYHQTGGTPYVFVNTGNTGASPNTEGTVRVALVRSLYGRHFNCSNGNAVEIIMDGLTFYGQGNETNVSFSADGPANDIRDITIKNVRMEWFGHRGMAMFGYGADDQVYTGTANNLLVEHCYFDSHIDGSGEDDSDPQEETYNASDLLEFKYYSDGSIIRNNTFKRAGHNCCYVWYQDKPVDRGPENTIIEGNIFDSTGVKYSRAFACHGSTGPSAGAKLLNCIFRRNEIIQCNTASQFSSVGGSFESNIIRDCIGNKVFKGSGLGDNSQGVLLQKGDGRTVENVVVANNWFENLYDGGIHLFTSSGTITAGNVIVNNVFKNVGYGAEDTSNDMDFIIRGNVDTGQIIENNCFTNGVRIRGGAKITDISTINAQAEFAGNVTVSNPSKDRRHAPVNPRLKGAGRYIEGVVDWRGRQIPAKPDIGPGQHIDHIPTVNLMVVPRGL